MRLFTCSAPTLVNKFLFAVYDEKTSRFPWLVERVDLSSCNWEINASSGWDINSAYLSLCRVGMTRQVTVLLFSEERNQSSSRVLCIVIKWPQRRRQKPEMRCRLDFFPVNQSLPCNVTNSDISRSFKTDHSLITIKLELHPKIEVQVFFKLNTSLSF